MGFNYNEISVETTPAEEYRNPENYTFLGKDEYTLENGRMTVDGIVKKNDEFAISADDHKEIPGDIKEIVIGNCSFTALKISGFPNLEMVSILENSSNDIKKIEVEDCSNLKTIALAQSGIEVLTLGELPSLSTLDCQHNKLTELNLNNDQLAQVNCSGNDIKELSVVSENLIETQCGSNPLQKIVVESKNPVKILF